MIALEENGIRVEAETLRKAKTALRRELKQREERERIDRQAQEFANLKAQSNAYVLMKRKASGHSFRWRLTEHSEDIVPAGDGSACLRCYGYNAEFDHVVALMPLWPSDRLVGVSENGCGTLAVAIQLSGSDSVTVFGVGVADGKHSIAEAFGVSVSDFFEAGA